MQDTPVGNLLSRVKIAIHFESLVCSHRPLGPGNDGARRFSEQLRFWNSNHFDPQLIHCKYGGNGLPASGRENGVHERAERADGISARPACLSQNEYLDRAELTHVDAQIEIAIDAADRRLEEILDLNELKAGYRLRADLRDVYSAGAIHNGGDVEVDLPPRANEKLIARPNHIVGSHGNAVGRGEGAGNLPE